MCLLLSHIVYFQEGELGDLELNELTEMFAAKWKTLGIFLGISQDILEGIRC